MHITKKSVVLLLMVAFVGVRLPQTHTMQDRFDAAKKYVLSWWYSAKNDNELLPLLEPSYVAEKELFISTESTMPILFAHNTLFFQLKSDVKVLCKKDLVASTIVKKDFSSAIHHYWLHKNGIAVLLSDATVHYLDFALKENNLFTLPQMPSSLVSNDDWVTVVFDSSRATRYKQGSFTKGTDIVGDWSSGNMVKALDIRENSILFSVNNSLLIKDILTKQTFTKTLPLNKDPYTIKQALLNDDALFVYYQRLTHQRDKTVLFFSSLWEMVQNMLGASPYYIEIYADQKNNYRLTKCIEGDITSIAVGPNSLILGYSDGQVSIWDKQNGIYAKGFTFKAHNNSIKSLFYNNNTIISSDGTVIKVWKKQKV